MTKEYRQVGSYCWRLKFGGGELVLLTLPIEGEFCNSVTKAVQSFTKQFKYEQENEINAIIETHQGESLLIDGLTCLGSFIEEREIKPSKIEK